MNKNKSFNHPVFYRQAWNSVKMLDITSNNNKIFLKSRCCNKQIHIINSNAPFFQKPPQFSIFLKIKDMVLLKKMGDFYHIVKVLLTSRLVCAKIQFCQCYVRNFAIANTNIPQPVNDIRIFLKQRYTDTCIQQIGITHHQVSIILLFVFPLRKFSAISIASASPPQSSWNFAKALSSLILSRSFLSSILVDLVFISSIRICSISRSESHRRSDKLIPFNKVNRPSNDIVPVIIALFWFLWQRYNK